MPWVTFKADDIREALAVREIQIYEKAAGKEFDGTIQEGTIDRIDKLAARIVAQFRGIISGNPLVTELGPAGTIPAFTVQWAITIARNAMLGLNPVSEGETDPRNEEYKDATRGRDSLSKLPAAVFAIDEPSGASSTESGVLYGGYDLLEF